MKEVASGTPKTKAAVFCGISRDTLREWEKEDADFSLAVEEAEDRYVEALRRKVEKGVNATGAHDWRASAWLMERRDRDIYGKQEKPAPTGSGNVTVNNTVNLTVVSAKELADFQAREKQALEGLLHGRN